MIGIGAGIGLPFVNKAGGGPSVNNDFVIEVDTTQAGSASDTIILPLLSGGTYSGTIDWGDSSTSSLSYANRQHTYASGGTYTITISGDTFEGWRVANSGDRRKFIDISNWGFFTITTDNAFNGCSNLDITATDAPIITTSSFAFIFNECDALTTPDFSNWDTSSVSNMRDALARCNLFNGNVANWVHSGVTSLFRMFINSTNFNQDLDSWDVSGVTSWYEFMRGASAFNGSMAGWTVQGSLNELSFSIMNSFTGIGLDSWDTSGITSLRSAFGSNPVFNPDVSGWDVSGVTNMENTFASDPSFNQDLSAWDITNVSNFTNFMSGSTALSTANYDDLLTGWEATLQAAYPSGSGYPATININFGGSQYSCKSLTARNSLITTFGWTITDGGQDVSVNCDFVSTWDTTQAGSASDTVVLPLLSGGVYSGTIDWGDSTTSALSYANRTHVYASSGTYTITISGDVFDAWRFVFAGDRRKITDISNWGIFKFSSVGDARVFDGCENLTISATDAPNIGTSLDTAFRSCTSLTNEDFSHWDTSTVTIFRNCFTNCTNFNGTVNGWDTSSATNFQSMFQAATSFNQPVNLFDMSNATNVSRMFNGATSFNQDLNSWDVSNVTSWSEFMRNASAFNGSLAGWTVKGSFNELTFSVMNAFTGTGLDSWNTSGLTSLRKAFQYNPNFNPDISGWDTSSVTNMDSVFWALPLFEQDLSGWDITNVTTLNNFMLSTNFNTSNYDALLVGWEATLQAAYPGGAGYPHTISARFGNSQYSSALMNVGEARYNLVNVFGWTITDGGAV